LLTSLEWAGGELRISTTSIMRKIKDRSTESRERVFGRTYLSGIDPDGRKINDLRFPIEEEIKRRSPIL